MTKQSYLTKTVAAKRLGISPRRLVELAAAGQINRHYNNGPNGRRIALFDEVEVDELLQNRIDAVPVAAGAPGAGKTAALVPMRYLEAITAQLNEPVRKLEPVFQAVASQINPTKKNGCDALWLTPAEAAEYSGLPASFLVSMIEAKKLPALDVGVRKGGRWRISRRDVDAITATRQKR